MATAKKLPSGSWRVQIFSHYEFVRQPDGSVKKNESMNHSPVMTRQTEEKEKQSAWPQSMQLPRNE